jgi:Na+-translocating ferredoxin:NAD+ oxidoreductase RnfG subunit
MMMMYLTSKHSNPEKQRREFLKLASAVGLGLSFLSVRSAQAKTYMNVVQAQKLLLPNEQLSRHIVTLSDDQAKSIQSASKVRVRSKEVKAWRSVSGDWFLLEQIIGKHENIDMAFALDSQGRVLGMEVLTYRESYGHEIRHPKWRAQFHGRGNEEHLKLDQQIKNISGATLSCRHVTDGVNRITTTWALVLQYL